MFKTKTITLVVIFLILATFTASAYIEPDWENIKKIALEKKEREPEDIMANYNLAISQLNLGEIKSAYRTIKNFENKFDQRDFIDIVSPYIHLANRYPDNILLLNYSGFFGYINRNYNLSIKYFKMILELTPDNYHIRNFLSASYIEKGKLDYALQEAEKALETKDNKLTHLLLGVIYYRQDEIVKALNEFSKSGDLMLEYFKNNQ